MQLIRQYTLQVWGRANQTVAKAMISIKYTTRGFSRGKFILKLTITFDYMRKFYLVSITFPYVEVYTDIRPWGKFEKFHENELCTVKLIYINSNSRLSLQYHRHRWEFWKILKGTAEVELEGAKVSVKEGEHIKIGTGVKHRIKAYEDCIVLEISYGRFDENDITRIEDDYGRVK